MPAAGSKSAGNQGGAANVARRPLFQHGWMRIEDIRIEDHRSDLAEELESLQRSINKVGLLQLPVVTHEGHLLVCGERRVEALRAQGRTKIPVRFVKNMEDGLRLLVAMRDENKERRPRSPLDADRLANKIKALIAAAAKERQRQGGKLKGKVVGAAHQLGPKGKTRDLVAEFVGVSPRTLKKIEVVKKSGRRELIGKMQKTGNVDAAYKKLMADLPLDMPILQLDGALKRLLPKIQGLVDAITAQEPANASFVEGLAARLIEIGSLGARLQSKGAIAKQQPETAKTAKVRLMP